jgi:hypothetical protein
MLASQMRNCRAAADRGLSLLEEEGTSTAEAAAKNNLHSIVNMPHNALFPPSAQGLMGTGYVYDSPVLLARAILWHSMVFGY